MVSRERTKSRVLAIITYLCLTPVLMHSALPLIMRTWHSDAMLEQKLFPELPALLMCAIGMIIATVES